MWKRKTVELLNNWLIESSSELETLPTSQILKLIFEPETQNSKLETKSTRYILPPPPQILKFSNFQIFKLISEPET